MTDFIITVPLRDEDSALPSSTLSQAQFALADVSFGRDYRTVQLTDDTAYSKVPMELCDQIRSALD